MYKMSDFARLELKTRTVTLSIALLTALIVCLLLASCDGWFFPSVLDEIESRGEVVVITRNSPTTYYENADGEHEGIEYQMAMAFADHLNVKARFVVSSTATGMLEALDRGEGDFIAGGLTMTNDRLDAYDFGPGYQQVEQQLICRRNGGPIPKSLNDLTGIRIWVSKNTSYEQQLTKLSENFPGLKWTSSEELGTEDLLEMVWEREISCTVSDSNIFAINRRYYPELVLAFPLAEPESLSWVMRKNSVELKEAMGEWYEEFSTDDQMKILLERYYGFVDGEYDYVGTVKFHRATGKVLPKYRQWFEQAGEKYSIDWLLLAAVSYQESHWNPRAKSPTGVRGIMMITKVTAKHLGLKDRLDPKASIFAGAKYLAKLRSRLPEHIEEPQRTWMALAAYNMGFGHFRDARVLAKKLNKNPDRWNELESVLPLLSRKKHYSNLKHGYARGGQALHYVNNVRDYKEQLSGFLFRQTVE